VVAVVSRRVLSEKLEGGGYITKAWSATESEAAAVEAACRSVPPARAFTPGLARGEAFDAPEPMPPNCDGHSGYAEPTTGEMLAQAQHIAAEDDEGCTSAVCAMTRGSGD
jgi:hypothetical protein